VPILTVRASETVPSGTYDARIVAVEDIGEGRFGKNVLRLVFELTDSQHLGKRLAKIVSATVSSRSRLGIWVGRLFGEQALKPGSAFDTTTLVGKSVRLAVVQQKRADGSVLNLVADLFAAQSSSSSRE